MFVAEGGKAVLTPDPEARVVNGGFEHYSGNTAAAYRFQDSPGQVSFIDTQVYHSGAASLRFENFTANPYGHGRVMQEIPVRPQRSYRVTVWVKTEGLDPPSAFRLQVLTSSGQALAPWNPNVPASTEWRKLVFGFNSAGNEAVRLYIGAWGGRAAGSLDDLSIEEVGRVTCFGATALGATW